MIIVSYYIDENGNLQREERIIRHCSKCGSTGSHYLYCPNLYLPFRDYGGNIRS